MPNPLTDDTYGPNGPMNQDLDERTARAQALSDLVNQGLMEPVPNVLMQPDLLEAGTGLQPKAGTLVDELGRVYDKATNQPIQETRRPSVLPITRTPEGNLEFAMPRALDIIGNVAGGAIAPVKAAKGDAIMGAGPVRKSGTKLTPVDHNPFAELPMDEASRMQRARDMGFDVDNPVYHGTDREFNSFDPRQAGAVTKVASAKEGTWFAKSKDTAEGYAELAKTRPVQELIDASHKAERAGQWDKANSLMVQAEKLEAEDAGKSYVGQYMIRGKVKEIDMDGIKYDPQDVDLKNIVKEAKKEGYEGVRLKNFSDEADYGNYNATDHTVVFDPKNIRSVNAQFDPAKKNSAMLLAADAPVGLVAGGVRDAYKRTLSPLGLYSHGAEAAAGLQQAKGTPEQYAAMLQKAGVKPVEMEGFNEAFAGRPSVTREELAKHFNERMPQVEERVSGFNPRTHELYAARGAVRSELKGLPESDPKYAELWNKHDAFTREIESIGDTPTKFQQYTLPGGENYREVRLKLPERGTTTGGIAQKLFGRNMNDLSVEEGRAVAEEMRRLGPSTQSDFTGSHWSDPNVLAHLRMADRTGPNGEKILHVEEIQSDWAQKGRKEGFAQPSRISKEQNPDGTFNVIGLNQDRTQRVILVDNVTAQQADRFIESSPDKLKGSIPNGPYVGNTAAWTDLALKRALKEAAEGGYDRLVWTPGAEQAKRYDLSKHIDEVQYSPGRNGTFSVEAYKGRNNVFNKPNASEKEIADTFGKEIADKITAGHGEVNRDTGYNVISGLDLQTGGEGMKSYYDKIVPTRLKEIVKRIDPEAKIEMVDVDTRSATDKKMNLPAGQSMNTVKVPSIQMTPKLKEAIKKGLPAFSIGGAAALGVANQANSPYKMTPVDHNPFD
jgi:hypothetical protein